MTVFVFQTSHRWCIVLYLTAEICGPPTLESLHVQGENQLHLVTLLVLINKYECIDSLEL